MGACAGPARRTPGSPPGGRSIRRPEHDLVSEPRADSPLTWIDPFTGSAEHAGADLSGLEVRFRANTARFGTKLDGHVGRSQDVLRRKVEEFDLIHLDGSHEAPDVLADAVLAWPRLAPGGLLGFDDYGWKGFPEPQRCPALAVEAFLNVMRGRFDELHRGYEVWVRKTR